MQRAGSVPDSLSTVTALPASPKLANCPVPIELTEGNNGAQQS